MQAEVRWIEWNDKSIPPEMRVGAPSDRIRWYTVGIGQLGKPGADLFQVAIATHGSFIMGNRVGPFVGLVVDQFEELTIETTIREYVKNCEALTWNEVVERLRIKMKWEYDGFRA